jgi:regulator of sigma E protease
VGGALTLKTIHVPPWVQLADDALWTWRSFVSLLNPRSDIGLSKMSGPIGIAERVQTFAKLDFRLVLAFVVLVNVNLAIFNLLPIPVLDGGQILFATIGRLRGRALPVKFVAATQSIFVVLILAMMAYVTVFGDLRRIVRDAQSEPAGPEPAPRPGPAKP